MENSNKEDMLRLASMLFTLVLLGLGVWMIITSPDIRVPCENDRGGITFSPTLCEGR